LKNLSIDGDIATSSNAFKNIEEENFYPQVYIPFYEELKENKTNTNSRTLSTDKNPTIVVYTGDESQEVYEGFTLDEQGNLKELGRTIDEEYAQNNEVWVISLSETVFGDCEDPTVACQGTGDTSSTGRVQSSPNAILANIMIRCNKESWAAGASEVHIITMFSNYGMNSGSENVEVYGGRPNQGGRIFKFSRKDVRKRRNKGVQFPILNNWDNRAPNTDYANYVIFEYDAFPTGRKWASWQLGGYYKWQYRSKDIFYDKSSVWKYDFNGHSVDTNCIRWNSTYQ